MSMDSLAQIEEERRLLYVAITRAEVNCVITFATSRYHNGQTKSCVMSRFLRDISPDYLLMGSTNSAPVTPRTKTRFFTEAKPRSTRTTTTAKPKTAPLPKQTPTARPVSPTPPPPAGSGSFTIHTVEELSVGCEILHQRFGRGTVTSIDTSSDAKIDVAFLDGQTRKLLLKFAKFEIL